MPLEATMICIDNSDWARNGDFGPTRWDAEQDASMLIIEAKLGENPENSVGILTMAGPRVQMLLTPSQDRARMISIIQNIELPNEEIDFCNGLQIAQLALKHRQNKNQRQRIIVFVGSPLNVENRKLVQLAKKLKKNNVAVDIVNFGGHDNVEKLEQFMENVNTGDNSHMLNLSSGSVSIISDALLTSPILMNGGGGDLGGGNMGAAGVGGGAQVDPNLDPELAMALRISMEEQRAQELEEQKKAAEEGKEGGGEGGVTEGGEKKEEGGKPEDKAMEEEEDDWDNLTDEQQLERAIMMSLEGVPEEEKQKIAQEQIKASKKEEVAGEEEAAPRETKEEEAKEFEHVIQDKDFMSDLLRNLPGVDMAEEDIQQMMEKINPEKEKKEKDEEKDKDKEDEDND